tara:strand:- start:261 stop:929 length:669 start_codon:yes stop_codon:yes gene_type:complete
MKYITLIFFLMSTVLLAQKRLQYGTLPTLTLSKDLKNDWKLTSKIENRTLFYQKNFSETNSKLDYTHTDFALLGSKKVGLSNQVSAGFQIRLGEDIEKRSIQQFNVVTDYYKFQLAHRLAADQTFVPNQPVTYRFRYRLTYNKPLSGNEINANELYFKSSVESLFIFEKDSEDLEIRFVPSLGYNFKSSNKLELGIDNRLDGTLLDTNRYRCFLVINYYVKM